MNFLDKLERKLGRIAITNVSLYLVMGQGLIFLFSYAGKLDVTRAMLIPALVLEGEWWRLLTFLFIPPSWSLIFIFFALYLFYLMGSALENHWGAFRYNLFLLVGCVLTVAAAFLTPYQAATNVFIGGSVFLAFAFLFPDFQLYIFFILPVKIKWLALITWIGYGWQLITGGWQTRFLVLASIGNFLLFFGKDIALRMRYGGRKMASQARDIARSREPFHRCTSCGKTDLSHPDMEFRYCPECGGLGYCMEHIGNHEHRSKKG
jgi:hypothetical protein